MLESLRIINTDDDPSLQIESSAMVNLRGVSTQKHSFPTMCSCVLQCRQTGLHTVTSAG